MNLNSRSNLSRFLNEKGIKPMKRQAGDVSGYLLQRQLLKIVRDRIPEDGEVKASQELGISLDVIEEAVNMPYELRDVQLRRALSVYGEDGFAALCAYLYQCAMLLNETISERFAEEDEYLYPSKIYIVAPEILFLWKMDHEVIYELLELGILTEKLPREAGEPLIEVQSLLDFMYEWEGGLG